MKTIEEAAKEYNSKCIKEGEDNDALFISRVGLRELNTSTFKAGVEFAQKWIPVEKETPITYEEGVWDGLRSDFVIAKNSSNTYYIVRVYEGVIDGVEFCDFVDIEDNYILNITHWRPIEFK